MKDKRFPIIAIVIDDLGMQLALTERAIGLDPFVTLAFLPYASDVVSQVALARSAGHEVLLHMPMEPLSGSNDPGPNALYVDLEFREMLRRLRWAFDQIPHAVGLNNHMGSKFTADENAMATVIGEMKSRDLIFLDSRTTPESIATDSLPNCLEVTAETEDGLIMGLRHREYPIFGVQFHPESIASENGHDLLANFLDIARISNAD